MWQLNKEPQINIYVGVEYVEMKIACVANDDMQWRNWTARKRIIKLQKRNIKFCCNSFSRSQNITLTLSNLCHIQMNFVKCKRKLPWSEVKWNRIHFFSCHFRLYTVRKNKEEKNQRQQRQQKMKYFPQSVSKMKNKLRYLIEAM